VQSRLSEVQAAALSPIQMVRNFMQREPARTEPPNELDQLRQRIAELEERISASAPAKAKRNGRRKTSTGKRTKRKATKSKKRAN